MTQALARSRRFNYFHPAAANVAKGRRHAATEGATDVPDHNDGDLSSRGPADLASGRSTILVAQRENDLTPGQPSQLPDLAYRQPAQASLATSEYFAPPARYDHWTQCQRRDDRSRWTCQFVPPEGNGPQLMFNDDDWPSLLVQVLGLPFIGRAADDGYKIIDGERLPCLLFGHTATACFFSDGLIGYYSGSCPAWPVTVTRTSYSPHVSANTFRPLVKPLPWNYQAASIVSRPLITPVAVAGAHGYLWFAGSGMVARTILVLTTGGVMRKLRHPITVFVLIVLASHRCGSRGTCCHRASGSHGASFIAWV